jgi:hypothetical protein
LDINLDKTWLGYIHFGGFFSQTHLVTPCSKHALPFTIIPVGEIRKKEKGVLCRLAELEEQGEIKVRCKEEEKKEETEEKKKKF